MVASGVDKDTRVLPSSRFEPGVLLDGAEHFKTAIGDGQDVFSKESNVAHICGPDNMTALGQFHLSSTTFLLDIEEGESFGVAQEDAAGSSIENLITRRSLDLFGQLILLVLDNNLH